MTKNKKKKRVNNSETITPNRVLERFTFNTENVKAKLVNLEGRKHLKVPCVMLVEGVLEGSHGPGFYPAEENSKKVKAWNHMPITLNHPTIKGKPVSARTSSVVNKFKVGTLLNVRQDGIKTKGVAYFDYERTKQLDNRLIAKLEKGEKVEVSTGLFLNMEKKSGVYNNKKYEWIARDHEPDHLAVLLDSVGACSIADGAGLLVNEKSVPESIVIVLNRSVKEALKPLGIEKIVNNEMSFSQISMHLSASLASAYGKPGQYWKGWIVEVIPDEVIFYNEDEKMYKVGYKTKKNTVEISGDPVEVTRQVSFVPVSNVFNQKGGEVMSFNKKGYVDSLIGNGFEENDREWLEKLEDKQLQKIKPEPKKEIVNSKNEEKQATQNNVTPQLTWEQIEAMMPPSKKAVLNFGQQTLNNIKQQCIETIKNSPGNKLTDEQLASLPADVLTNMANVAKSNMDKTKEQDNEVEVFANGFVPNFFNIPTTSVGNYEGASTVNNKEQKTEEKKALGPTKWQYPNRIK